MNDPRLAHLLNSDDQKALDRMIDDDTFYGEHERLHVVPAVTEGNDIGE